MGFFRGEALRTLLFPSARESLSMALHRNLDILAFRRVSHDPETKADDCNYRGKCLYSPATPAFM